MQARRLPAARGAFWLFEGFRLFRRNPQLIITMTLTFLLLLQIVVLLLADLAAVVLPLIMPALTLVLANGCRLVDAGQRPSKPLLLRGLSDNGVSMARLGGLHLLGTLLVMLLSMLLGDGSVQPDPAITGANPDAAKAAMANAAQLQQMLSILLLATPMIIAFWFAPYLVGWDRVKPFKALFFSIIASLRNWRAMFVYSLALLVFAALLPAFGLLLISQMAGIDLHTMEIALRLVLVFLIMPVIIASIYVSYRDIFQTGIDAHA